MLADLPEADVVSLYAGCELVTPTGRRLAGVQELLALLREARRRGYGENLDETALGLHCIAAPVGPPGRVAAAITLCVPSGRMNAERKRQMLPDLLAAARELTPTTRSSANSSTNFSDARVDSPETRNRRKLESDRKVAT
jgi:DNA-binding IclR family transcriptional regulator